MEHAIAVYYQAEDGIREYKVTGVQTCALPIFLGAAAEDVLTTVPRGSYDFFSGSSMAAAQVSGVAALLLERNPKLTPAQLAAAFRETARRADAADGGGTLEPAEIDACAELARATDLGPR